MKLFIFLVLVLLITLLITYIGDVIKKPKEPIVLNFKKWVFPNSAYPNWHRAIKNGYSIKMVDTGIALPTNKYSISFMYKLTAISSVWTNVFHITNVATADGGPWGGRNPSLWINPNYPNFHLRFATNDNNSDGFDQVGIAPLNTVAFVTFVFNINTVTIYVNGVNKVSSNFNGINSIVPTATLYIANPNEETGFAQLQDFTIYDGVLTPDQITIIYNESIQSGRDKIKSDELATQLRVAEEQRAAQRSAHTALTLTKLNTQLNATSNTNLVELQNIRNRIAQYQSI